MRQKKKRPAKPAKKKKAQQGEVVRHLTERQRRFVMAYVGRAEGNATEAARIAGYKHPNKQGPALVNLGAVKEAIAEFVAAEKVLTVMDRRERQAMLSLIGRGSFELDERIRAIDVMNKMDGIYIQRHEISARIMKAPLGEIAEQTAEALRELGATVIPPKGGWPEDKK